MGRPAEAASELRPLDRWLVDRTHALVREATAAYEAYLTVDVDPRLRGVRRRPLELVHPPLAAPLLGRRRVALHVLWYALVQSLRVVAPVMPFLDRAPLAEPRARRGREPPASVHLAGWPDAAEPDDDAARRGRGGAARRRARPPGARRVAAEAAPAAAAARRRGRAARARRTPTRSREELRVKEVEFGHGRGDRAAREAEPAGARPEARQGARRRAGRARSAASSRSSRAAASASPATSSAPTRCSSSAPARRAGRSRRRRASRSRSTPTLDDELELEGRVYDLIHTLNSMRKEQGLELTDRITVTLPQATPTCSRSTPSGSSARCSRSRSRPTASPSRDRQGRASRRVRWAANGSDPCRTRADAGVRPC